MIQSTSMKRTLVTLVQIENVTRLFPDTGQTKNHYRKERANVISFASFPAPIIAY